MRIGTKSVSKSKSIGAESIQTSMRIHAKPINHQREPMQSIINESMPCQSKINESPCQMNSNPMRIDTKTIPHQRRSAIGMGGRLAIVMFDRGGNYKSDVLGRCSQGASSLHMLLQIIYFFKKNISFVSFSFIHKMCKFC